VFITPCLAIDEPDSLSINGVYVYRNCQEVADQLYLIDYTILYPVDGEPDEDATEAYLVRLMDGTDELGAVAPYSYYYYGYDRGVVAIYFSAADAPGWGGDYTMTLEGNPMFTWNAERPYVSVNAFNVWADNPMETTQEVLSSRILWLADQLEIAWEVDMITTAQGGSFLTEYGEAYFGNVIPDLRTMAPFVYSSGTVTPIIPDVVNTGSYEETIYTNYIQGTPLDMTPLAELLNVTRGTATAIVYYGLAILICLLICRAINTYKPLMLFLLPFLVVGPMLGASVWITVITGAVAGLLTAFEVLYKPSGE
jgi:hypothetical protein